MARFTTALVTFALFATLFSISLAAQDDWAEDSKLNTNLAFPLTVPVGKASNLVTVGTGITAGAGYTFNEHHSLIGEFMWSWLYSTSEALVPLQQALGSNALNGHSNLFVVTGNYRFEMRGHRFGGYIIGGPGMYYRNAATTTHVDPLPGTACTPVWQWWGFPCSGGIVQPTTSTTFVSAVLGGNAGGGLTIKVGSEPRYRMYFEARYHYAPFGNNTAMRFIPITTGIRF